MFEQSNPVNNKAGRSITDAFNLIAKTEGLQWENRISYGLIMQGTECYNGASLTSMVKENDIKMFSIHNERKAELQQMDVEIFQF